MHNLRVIISGGGSGGHVFPAIAIANKIKELYPNSEILFVGAKGKIEMEKVPAAGYRIEGLWISGLQRKITTRNLLFPLKLVCSLIKAKKIINKFQPNIVIGVGGFASGPLLRAATSMKIPALIQEQNSYPGITNKLLAGRVQKICVAYDNMDRFFPSNKIVYTGNPIRSEILHIPTDKGEAAAFFGLNAQKKTVLVIGGSLGAMTINRSIEKNIEFFSKNGIQLIWQTGKSYKEQANPEIKKYITEDIKVVEFINRMDLAYSIADIIVSRAGAIAVSELCCIGKPVILIPSPFVAEDHQTKNAKSLVEKDAVVMIKDSEADMKIVSALESIVFDAEKSLMLSANISKLAVVDAADRIVNEIKSLVL